jgi:capsular exopolysaccharide synthesis family protein
VPRYDKDSAHLVTEAYQNLRTALLFGRKGDAGQVVLVSGSIPSEGKTTTLVNIGKLLAVSGEKTLVVDGDLRRANLHHRLGLEREPGLTDAFTRQTPVAELVQMTRFRNLFALTAGALPPNPPALLAHPHARELLEEVRKQFRWILLDSPPLASVTDALLLAQLADMAVLVVQHNKVDRKLAKRSVAALRKVEGLNVVGAVLNAVDLETRGYYYYYYPRQGEQKARREDPGRCRRRQRPAGARPPRARRGEGRGGHRHECLLARARGGALRPRRPPAHGSRIARPARAALDGGHGQPVHALRDPGRLRGGGSARRRARGAGRRRARAAEARDPRGRGAR